MSDETVVEADGIRVRKSFDAEGFPVPAVRFDVTSTRDDETTLTITDEIPDEFDIDQIGFHPEYGSEHWTATGDGVVRFERSVDAHEEFTTVYGVRMSDDQEQSAFLDAPTLSVGGKSSETGIEDVIPAESSKIVRELAGGKRDTIPGLEPDEPAVSGAEAEPSEANEPLLDALHQDEADIADSETVEAAVTRAEDDEPDTGELDAEPTGEAVAEGATDDSDDRPAGTKSTETEEEPAPSTASASQSGADTTSPSKSGDSASISAADVAAELADQIRNGDVDDDDIDVLRRELASRRSNVQLEHLQSRVSEMEAYADALGAFIDENGDAHGLLEELRSNVESVESAVNGLQSSVDEASADRERIRDTLDDVEASLETFEDVDDRLDRVDGDVEALDERVEGVEDSLSEVESLREDLDDLRTDLDEFEEWRDQLSDVFGGA